VILRSLTSETGDNLQRRFPLHKRRCIHGCDLRKPDVYSGRSWTLQDKQACGLDTEKSRILTTVGKDSCFEYQVSWKT